MKPWEKAVFAMVAASVAVLWAASAQAKPLIDLFWWPWR